MTYLLIRHDSSNPLQSSCPSLISLVSPNTNPHKVNRKTNLRGARKIRGPLLFIGLLPAKGLLSFPLGGLSSPATKMHESRDSNVLIGRVYAGLNDEKNFVAFSRMSGANSWANQSTRVPSSMFCTNQWVRVPGLYYLGFGWTSRLGRGYIMGWRRDGFVWSTYISAIVWLIFLSSGIAIPFIILSKVSASKHVRKTTTCFVYDYRPRKLTPAPQ